MLSAFDCKIRQIEQEKSRLKKMGWKVVTVDPEEVEPENRAFLNELQQSFILDENIDEVLEDDSEGGDGDYWYD